MSSWRAAARASAEPAQPVAPARQTLVLGMGASLRHSARARTLPTGEAGLGADRRRSGPGPLPAGEAPAPTGGALYSSPHAATTKDHPRPAMRLRRRHLGVLERARLRG